MSTTTKVLSKIFLLALAFVVFGATQYIIDGSLPDILLVQNWWLSLPCFFIPAFMCWLFSNQNHRLFTFLPDYIRAGSIFLLVIILGASLGTFVTRIVGGSSSSMLTLGGLFYGYIVWWQNDSTENLYRSQP